MELINELQQKRAIRTWLNWKVRNASVLMLSLKTVFKAGNSLSILKPQNKLSYFLHKLNQRVFKSSYFGKGHRVEIIPSYEIDSDEHYHFHCVLKSPTNRDGTPYCVEKLQDYVRICWEKSGDGTKNGGVDLRPIYSEKGLEYCVKFEKGLEKENIDWVNVHWNSN